MWLFRDVDGYSILYNYFYFTSTPDNVRHLYCWPSLIKDPQLFNQQSTEHEEIYSCVANLLITYLAVKKYAQVETIIVPSNGKLIVEDEIQGYKKKEKVLNESGQEVIIMDSRWFVKLSMITIFSSEDSSVCNVIKTMMEIGLRNLYS